MTIAPQRLDVVGAVSTVTADLNSCVQCSTGETAAPKVVKLDTVPHFVPTMVTIQTPLDGGAMSCWDFSSAGCQLEHGYRSTG